MAKIDAMENKGSLKLVTTVKNIADNHSIKLQKLSCLRNQKNDKYYRMFDPNKALMIIRELGASTCSPIGNLWTVYKCLYASHPR